MQKKIQVQVFILPATPVSLNNETFEKYRFLFKFKKGDNFNHPGEIRLRISLGRQEYVEYFED